jgi:tetratricopeptide (TPR) repeat protein
MKTANRGVRIPSVCYASRMLKASAAWAVLVLAACGPAARSQVGDPREALRGLAPRTDPALALDDDEDLHRAHALFRVMPDGPERIARRKELWTAYARRLDRALAAGRHDQAFVLFSGGLGLWTPRELRDANSELAMVGASAEKLHASFSKGGAAAETMTILAVLIATHPEKAAEYQKQFEEIRTYLDDLAAASDEGGRATSAIGALERALLAFPSPWTGETLVKLYLARNDILQQAIASGNAHDPRLAGVISAGAMTPVTNIVRVYALLDRIDDAKPVVEKLARNAFDEEKVRELLARCLAPESKGEDWLRLARVFLHESGDPADQQKLGLTTAQRVCESAAARLPRASEPRMCAGAVAADLRQTPLAIHWLEEAHKAAPNDFEIVEYLARLYDRRLRDYMSGERIDAGRRVLAEMEKFHADVKRRFPKKTTTVPLSDGYMTLAQGLFNVGDVDGAVVIWKKAAAGGATAEATEQLGLVSLKRGQFDDAARRFEEAAALPRETPLAEKFDRARLLRLAGEAHEGAGRKARAKELWTASLTDWQELTRASLPPFQRAQVYLGHARVLYYLGSVREAIRSLEQAIDLDKEESSIYADAIAFLLTRGHYEPALDAFHRALGRDEISEYFKVYTSLWIIDFSKIRKVAPPPLALEYLASREGSRWYHELARYRSGRIDYRQLYLRADTRGKRAEAYFYEALARYGAGDDDEAEKLLRLTLATEMLGFFEYDMARYFLDHGPPR